MTRLAWSDYLSQSYSNRYTWIMPAKDQGVIVLDDEDNSGTPNSTGNNTSPYSW